MKKQTLEFLRCPVTHSRLTVQTTTQEDHNEIIQGTLVNGNGTVYQIENGIADITTEEHLTGDAMFARNYYKQIAHTYDDNVDITFTLYHEDEAQVRNSMVNMLGLTPDSNVLEVSAGTGKDSEIILSQLTGNGKLTCLDISPDMLARLREKFQQHPNFSDCISGTACDLPFADNSFDALYCFAGVGHFPDLKKGLAEMARVVKTGGKVVFCEKHVPVWLRDTEYGKILINNNPMFAYDDPLKNIPVEARNLGIRWILGNVHYVVDYEVGEGAPVGNFDLELPGARGGTFNTRYYGKIEGVTDETKALALEAQKAAGKSMHTWLDEVVAKAAKDVLGKKE